MKTGKFLIRLTGFAAILLGTAVAGWASEVHTNPLNRDPLVREAYAHFYNLDYSRRRGAI